MKKIIRQINPANVAIKIVAIALLLGGAVYVSASSTSNFSQVITGGTLAIDIVDASYVTVGSPSIAMSSKSFSFSCQDSTGTFGTATQQIYVKNPDAADNGWTVALAASAPTAVWDGANNDFDFNDANGSGCTDGADADSVGGQMTVDPSVGTLAVADCASCTTTGITKGISSSFIEGTTDSITLLTGASGSNDIGSWKLTGVGVTQKLPGELPAASDYNINMVLSVTAS